MNNHFLGNSAVFQYVPWRNRMDESKVNRTLNCFCHFFHFEKVERITIIVALYFLCDVVTIKAQNISQPIDLLHYTTTDHQTTENLHQVNISDFIFSNPEFFRYQYIDMIPAISLAQKAQLSSRNNTVALAIIGACLAVGGGITVVLNTMRAEDAYGEYKNSGFTENTNRYRDRVQRFDAFRLIGAGVTFTGGVIFTISFALK